MDMSKKYYWLKLQHDFFERDEIKIIEAMDNGKDYIIFYMKLLLKSIKTEGELRFSDTIPYNEKMLATITDTNIDIVRSALKMFIELHLIERWSDATLYMIETQNMIGSETDAAKRMRRYRERKALAEGEKKPAQLEDTTVVDEDKEDKLEDGKCNNVTEDCNNVTSQLHPVTNSYTEIDIEKEIEIDKEINKEKEKDPQSIVPIDDYKFPEGCIELDIAYQLREMMLQVKPDRKDIPDPTTKGLQSWSQHIDYMIRLDERDPRAIVYLFKWTQGHDFWQMNIKSPTSLRKQWDRLEMQMRKEQGGSTFNKLANINAQLRQGKTLGDDDLW